MSSLLRSVSSASSFSNRACQFTTSAKLTKTERRRKKKVEPTIFFENSSSFNKHFHKYHCQSPTYVGQGNTNPDGTNAEVVTLNFVHLFLGCNAILCPSTSAQCITPSASTVSSSNIVPESRLGACGPEGAIGTVEVIELEIGEPWWEAFDNAGIAEGVGHYITYGERTSGTGRCKPGIGRHESQSVTWVDIM